MYRFFVGQDQIDLEQKRICVTGTDVNHIKNVLRMKKGEEVLISDGESREYTCQIDEISQGEVLLAIMDGEDANRELPSQIYLFQGLPKSDKMELIIQKAVELGVYAIVPVVMKRTIVKLDAKKEAKKLTRWQQIAESAAKQSGRGLIPEVMAPVSFKEALNMASELEAAVLPYEKASGMEDARTLVHSMRDKKSIGIFIGPEGGFDESEVEAAIAQGVHTMTLGRRILRTETAGLTALSILMFELDN